MYKVLVIISIIFIFFGCGHTTEIEYSKPKPFINHDKMIEIITDFRITEGAIRQMVSYGEDSRVVTEYYYKKVLKKYDITPETYKANLEYYANKPDEMHEIYSEVVNKLTEMHTELSTRK